MTARTIVVACVAFVAGAVVTRAYWPADVNFEPTYGSTGLPKNCRAIVQANIDSFRAKRYSADEVMGSLERNCGRFGYSWRP